MQEVLARRRKQQLERIEVAKQFVQKLREEIGPITAWVYGSVAKGTFKTWSDIDVFVVAENLPDHPLQRLEVLYRFVSGGVEPKAWKLVEFLSRLERGDKQLLAMLGQRVLLLDELNLEPRLQEKILEICANAQTKSEKSQRGK
ncbi:MAG: nucleotidyltransferase domain-containing protein [Armatimonadetes bacterium]|nr:nucleotidyltransferase domain-containing protein [Armatimonadota bacterium]MCX7967558.1 nucleotidyltransferase domain-containing protein [Armatimonadota bacterium]MDW8143221.1 nucleotidyltransferase domain-containing protein [Armatimonadota bacterium]